MPPDGITEHHRDPWRVAVDIFLTSDTHPKKTVETLAEIARDDPDFAVSVARWLRREIRRISEGYRLEPPVVIHSQEEEANLTPKAPTQRDGSLPGESVSEQQSDDLMSRVPHLTSNEYAILQALARVHPQLIKIADLAIDLECRRGAASEAVQSLESQRFVLRPKGERSGVGITSAGLNALRPCDRSSSSI